MSLVGVDVFGSPWIAALPKLVSHAPQLTSKPAATGTVVTLPSGWAASWRKTSSPATSKMTGLPLTPALASPTNGWLGPDALVTATPT
jgi:hypothetical protein